jgi:hypothetical protein
VANLGHFHRCSQPFLQFEDQLLLKETERELVKVIREHFLEKNVLNLIQSHSLVRI